MLRYRASRELLGSSDFAIFLDWWKDHLQTARLALGKFPDPQQLALYHAMEVEVNNLPDLMKQQIALVDKAMAEQTTFKQPINTA